ncbi:hypothetical protein Z517_00361 [Fonsecaea pedrosoi CBS 271.37]|uniref:NACHT-NTPase and P-loop NTPases N-terminal domain-containing protein n=1 Tax=Fonsecaea pedrosoi CBS 271.37 TaxID=1442368 RepID=A0A0D2GVL1_9EURO|nr:uncharacterized protein Z517_00361 [Fonsecaea pedrosoi CBS 271.37]KIW84973.1 hypothetical protein Z517_00361 [Fonsecaea pedrosoi CBS 271.37]
MEVVGAFSAVLTVAVEFHELARTLRRCFVSLKFARKDVKEIHNEVKSFSTLLSLFHSTVTDERLANDDLPMKIKTSGIAQHISVSGREALARIDDILTGLDPLRSDKVYSVLEQWYARWKWSTRKEKWSPIQVLLNSIKANATWLIAIVDCHHRLQKIDQLNAEKSPIPNELVQQL